MTAEISMNRAAYLNKAADFVELGNEERATAKDMNGTVTTVALCALAAFVMALGIASTVLLKAIEVGASLNVPLIVPTLVGCGALQFLAICSVIYAISSRNKHLNYAKQYEKQAVDANAQAATLPPWDGMGLLSGLFSRLFSWGNPVTNYGAGTLGGRRENRGSWNF